MVIWRLVGLAPVEAEVKADSQEREGTVRLWPRRWRGCGIQGGTGFSWERRALPCVMAGKGQGW